MWQITDNSNILIIITDGRCRFTCQGETEDVTCGDAYFIPAGVSYIRQPIDGELCTMTYIHFDTDNPFVQQDTDMISDTITADKERLDLAILSGDTDIEYPSAVYIQSKNATVDFDKIKEILNSINLFSTKRQLMCNLQASISLCNILALLSQYTIDKILTDSSIRDTPRIPPKLKGAISYITRHYSEQISLGRLADHCNVSKQQMIRYFKAMFNTTPTNYITQYKIAKAKEFLFNNPDLSIKEIAAELGFDNQHYFTRVFCKATGETPSHYRERTHNYKE